MMLCNRRLTFLLLFFSIFVNVYSNVSSKNDKDPFKSLGIPDLNPKSLLSEIEEESSKNKLSTSSNSPLKLKTIDDLPNFLKNSNLNEEEGIKVLTRFLIQDDFTLKKYGVVYDQTGFDGIGSTERIAPIGTEERLMQRARSASNIWFKDKYAKLEYDAYGAESLMDEIVPNWRIYKVLMIGKNGENTFIKVCVPLDESETALCSDKDEPCGPRANYVEKEKKKNEDYISRIRSNNFFKRKPGMGRVKLLPGEKIIAKDNDKKIILDSSTANNNNGGFYNPPSLDSITKNGDPLLNAFKTRNNNFMKGPNMQGVMGMNQGFPQPTHQFNGMNNNLNFGMNMSSNIQNLNQYNQGMIGSNMAFPQNSMNKSNPNSPPSQSYNFKQKDGISIPSSPPNMDNAQLLNELMQMKTQLNQMMMTMKQKDEIINQQQMKLSQLGLNNFPNNGMMNPNTYGNTNQLNQPNNGFLMSNTPNSIPNMNMNQNFYSQLPIPQN